MRLRYNRKIVLVVFLTVAVVFWALYPCLFNGFVNWDDNEYILHNPAIQHLSFTGIKHLFTSCFVNAYVPVTMVSFAADYHFFGLNPFPYHAINLILHIFNCVLVFFLIYAVSGNIAVAFITALFFGIHPLHVESVAWVSERKDVLYGFFFLASLLAYIRSRESGKRALYWMAFAFFILALFSKPAAVSLPLVLLCYEYLKKGKPGRTMLAGILPFFACAVVFSVVTVFFQHSAIRYGNPVWLDFIVACHGLLFYLEKTLVPVKLSCLYPYIELNHIPFIFFVVPVAVVMCACLVVFSRRYTRVVIFGSLFFLAAILPSLQLVPVGNAFAADRYMYLPSIGLFYIIAEGFVVLMRKQWKCGGIIKPAAAACLVLAIFICILLTQQRCRIWKNSLILWSDAGEKYHSSPIIYYNCGVAYLDNGNYNQAVLAFTKAIELNPYYAAAYSNRGVAYGIKGNYDQAISDSTRAVEINPFYEEAYNNRGFAYYYEKKYDKAWADMHKAEKSGYVNLKFLDALKKATGREK